MATPSIVAAGRPEIEHSIDPLKSPWRRLGTPVLVVADGARDPDDADALLEQADLVQARTPDAERRTKAGCCEATSWPSNCVRIGCAMSVFAHVPAVRRDALLRRLAQPAGNETRPRDGDPVIASGEPGERWLCGYPDDAFTEY